MSMQQRHALEAQLGTPDLTAGIEPPSIDEIRSGLVKVMSAMRVPSGIRTQEVELAGRPALRVSADPTRTGTILYFHGGSWVSGSPETALSLTGNLVVRTGFTAFSLDYRLAPEHPFPAGPDDCLAAYEELLRTEDPATIVFAGDSAGGGLAVTTVLAARDKGLPLPAAVVAFSPGLDATHSGPSMETKEGIDPFFTRAGFKHTGAMYLAGQDPDQPLLSPATRADLTGFPPLLLQVGTNELLLDDSVRMARRAIDAGVDVILDVTAGVPHVFQAFTGLLDEADEALDRAARFIEQQVSA